MSYSLDFQLKLPNEWTKSCKIIYYLAIPEILFQNNSRWEKYDSFLLSRTEFLWFCFLLGVKTLVDFKIELFLIMTSAGQEEK